MDEILSEIVRLILAEEFIGQKGGVRYYQMGGSIKRDDLYNLDSSGKPTRDPGVPGLTKSKKKTKKRK